MERLSCNSVSINPAYKWFISHTLVFHIPPFIPAIVNKNCMFHVFVSRIMHTKMDWQCDSWELLYNSGDMKQVLNQGHLRIKFHINTDNPWFDLRRKRCFQVNVCNEYLYYMYLYRELLCIHPIWKNTNIPFTCYSWANNTEAKDYEYM